MRQRLIVLLPVLVFVALALAFWFGLGRDPKLVPSALIDQEVPSFELPPLVEGQPGLASADLSGEVTLVNVFASWCVPCRAEHPLWMRVAAQGEGPRLVAINYKDEGDAARAWLDELGDPYSLIGVDADGRTAIDWGVYGVPETFLVDAEGRIRYKHVGPVTETAWNERLLPMIESLRR